MNTQISISPSEVHLLNLAADALAQSMHRPVSVSTLSHMDPGQNYDRRIELKVGNWRMDYLAEIRQKIDHAAQIARFAQVADTHETPFLLVIPIMRPHWARQCQELGLQFIDAAGNAYLHDEAFFVQIAGRSLPETIAASLPKTSHSVGSAFLRYTFQTLCAPATFSMPYRRIPAEVGVSIGMMSRVVDGLVERGLVAIDRDERRQLLEPDRLLTEWVSNYPMKLRSKLIRYRMRAPSADWWKYADLEGSRLRWGAEVAADRLIGHLRPAKATLYHHASDDPHDLRQFIIKCRLQADAQGDVEILDAFWSPDLDGPQETVPPVLIYADLVNSNDPRNLEAAQRIYADYVKPMLHSH
ncbi:type IV toxin-antitoxin system AbiEi family antitoxin [Chitinimonas arctica]|nr:type IV toxin-antitoxin system AbiEi family antitoxin [Chitinimonas arctica]